jgi:hypothetical protein
MRFGRIVISSLLLLTYSFGFTHNLVPHFQELNEGNFSTPHEKGHVHHHKHHQHIPNEDISSDHEHIFHEGHFDKGVYDLVLCFLNEMEHSGNECHIQHFFPVRIKDNQTEDLAKAKLLVEWFSAFADFYQRGSTIDFGPNVSATLTSPPLEQSPHRGPPSLTC